jgi:outer membrane receptor protein involved in Fe transport
MMDRRLSAVSAVALLRLTSAFANGDDDAPGGTKASDTKDSVTTTMGTSQDLDEVVVNGIRRGDLILPTTVSSSSAYGLDLSVMDTPRNNTLLSKAQLDALNVQNAGGFSYLTSSSYSDAAFGQPNVPRIRGQYADVFFNGMRDSFTDNGYGAPMSFNSFDSIDIVKGPASVQGGPGNGVGGSINIATKMPSLTKATADFSLEFDSQQKRKGSFDIGGPLSDMFAARVSFTDDGSGSYYTNMFFHQQSLFVALLGQITPKYSVLLTGGFENTTYRENDGINRVNQQLIDDGTYLTGGVVGGPDAITGFGSQVNLTGTTQLNRHTEIDEPDGDGAHSMHAKVQLIQTFKATDNFTVVNNTFFDYMNRYNEVQDYYADTAMGAFTIENKTDAQVKFDLGSVKNDIDAGFTFRYAHVPSIQNFANEPVSLFDLTGPASSFVFPASAQAGGGAVPYVAAFGRTQYGVAGRDEFFPNNTAISNLKDAALFLEHQIKVLPQLSVLYGIRGDLVQLNYSDPLGGPDPVNGLPQSASTAWYGLYNANVSVVYQPVTHVSTYLTYNKAEYVQPTGNDGMVATWGIDPTAQLRQRTLLEEGGVKLDLFDKRLFVSAAGFYQERSVSTGPASFDQALAHIHGAELELNYQPSSHFFATASYSYLHTTLDEPAGFYNFPAQLGLNNDGAGSSTAAANVFQPGQTFQDPGVPQQLINVLAQYKTDAGWGVQGNIQVTSPIDVSQSGFINVAAVQNGYPGLSDGQVATLAASGNYYKSPVIHWQYTANVAAFYSWRNYTAKVSIYNVTNEKNFTNDIPFYGNDFITVQPPRSYDLTLNARF